MHQAEIPPDKKVACASMVCNHLPLKEEKHRVCITVGGDRLPCTQDAGLPVADLLETKILLNSAISDARKGARFMSLDVKDHFLVTPMANPEHMRVRIKDIPPDIQHQHCIDKLVSTDGWVCAKIQKGMPGLKQAAILVHQHLKNSLEPYGYTLIPGTIGMWQHNKHPTKFCLCADDFGVKCYSKDNADHLCNSVSANFRCTVDKEGANCCGLSLSWNYKLGYADTSMPTCVPKALKRVNYQSHKVPQCSLH